MYAGRMKYRLIVMEPVAVKSNFGTTGKFDYRTGPTIRADRVRLTGRSGVEVGEQFADFNAVYNIRDAHRVDNNWRVQEVGGHLYHVRNVEPNRDRGMLTLYCERVNE